MVTTRLSAVVTVAIITQIVVRGTGYPHHQRPHLPGKPVASVKERGLVLHSYMSHLVPLFHLMNNHVDTVRAMKD